METQKITVEGENITTVSTDPTANVSALVLRGEELKALLTIRMNSPTIYKHWPVPRRALMEGRFT